MITIPCLEHNGPYVVFDYFMCAAHDYYPDLLIIEHNQIRYTLPVMMKTECIRYGHCIKGSLSSPCSMLVTTR